MSDNKNSGLKSSWELALERLDKKSGAPAALSAEQKKAIADIDSQARARVAELEILLTPKIAEARAKGDAEGAQQLEEQRQMDIAKIRERAEREKESVRRGNA